MIVAAMHVLMVFCDISARAAQSEGHWGLVPIDARRWEATCAFHTQETAMLENLERKMLLAELEGVLSKLRDQGIEPGLTDEEIETLDVKSLREAVRRFEKLARTPGGR